MPGTLHLHSERLAVDVTPGNGADITALVDRRSGVEVLFHSPWGRRDLAGAPVTGDSQVDWLARYGGGWQQLVPNAGAERTVDGVRRGYHGEAAVVAWSVDFADESRAELTTHLITAPLSLTRSLRVAGPTLHVRDTITNTSDGQVPVMWVQHPGFGAPFIDGHATLTAPARSVLTDADQPGTLLPPDSLTAFPLAPTHDGNTVDLRRVPAPHSRQSVFACLTEFTEGWYAIDSPSAGFGVRVEWDLGVFPHAWLWQECHASAGFPWYRRAYVVAIEPANVIPGEPSPTCPERGRAPLLRSGATWTSDISLTLTDRS